MDKETRMEDEQDRWNDLLADDMKAFALEYNGNELAKVVVKAIQAIYCPPTPDGLNVLVYEFGREMLSLAPIGPFPGGNCYDGTILKGGGGPAQY